MLDYNSVLMHVDTHVDYISRRKSQLRTIDSILVY